MNLIYLHGFASGPQSTKAQFFRRRFEELGIAMQIPDLSEGNFEGLTIFILTVLSVRQDCGIPATASHRAE